MPFIAVLLLFVTASMPYINPLTPRINSDLFAFMGLALFGWFTHSALGREHQTFGFNGLSLLCVFWLIYLGAVIFEIIASQQVDLRPVSPEEVMAAEEANVLLLEDLEEGSEMGFTEAVESLLVTYNQMPLLSALLEALMSPHEDNPELAPDHIGMALIHLKTVIDCLDQ